MNHAHHSKAARLRTKLKLGTATTADKRWLAEYERKVNKAFARVVTLPPDGPKATPAAAPSSSSALHETEPVPVAPPEQFASVPLVGEGDAAAPLAPEPEPSPEQKAKDEKAALDDAAEFAALVCVLCGFGLEAALANWGPMVTAFGAGHAVQLLATAEGKAKALGYLDAAARRVGAKWGLAVSLPYKDELLVVGAVGASVLAIKVNADRQQAAATAKDVTPASERSESSARPKVDPRAFDDLLGVAA